MCPNIEVESHVINKSPFFIRPNHVREEDKTLKVKEEMFMLFRNTKRRILSLL